MTSVFTADATWSRPIRSAEAYSCRRDSDGFAARSSHTALVCVTVTSSSTPSAPITTPASSSPRVSMGWFSTAIRVDVSSSMPVSFANAAHSAPSTPISVRLTMVPSTAVDVRADNPCVRYRTANMITPAPTMATSSGLSPPVIAGSTKNTSTRKLMTSAPSALRPCQRPRTSTAIANSAASSASGTPRWKSTSW